jgi:glycosyltransferase involved in cell wall biosynthesis
MACGTAVIGSDQPGQADLVRSTAAGVVVEPDQPGELAAAVAWLWSHPEERAAMGARGRRAIEADHTWDRRASDTDGFIRSLFGADRSA